MDTLTGHDATEALKLYARIGDKRFNRASVAAAMRTRAGRNRLSTIIRRSHVVSGVLRPWRFGRSSRPASSPAASQRRSGARAAGSKRPRRPDGGRDALS